MSDNSSAAGGGIGLGGIFGVVFIVLKLIHNIDWSWWWVLSPFRMPIALVLVLMIIYGLISLGQEISRRRKARR